MLWIKPCTKNVVIFLWVSYYSSSDKCMKETYSVPCEIRLARVKLRDR